MNHFSSLYLFVSFYTLVLIQIRKTFKLGRQGKHFLNIYVCALEVLYS